jgi:hypothetical protein
MGMAGGVLAYRFRVLGAGLILVAMASGVALQFPALRPC